MSKKLITAALALVALAAFALPASASAVSLGETSGGTFTALAKGSKITGTNVGNAKFVNSALGVISECSKVVVTGEVTSNGPEVIEGNVETATFSGEGAEYKGMKECLGESALGSLTPTTNGTTDEKTVASGTPWCIKTVKGADKFTVRGGKCTEETRAITFILDTTLAGECKYSRSAAIEGTFTTDVTNEDAVLTVNSGATSEFTREAGSGFFCPSTGSLQMSFTMETDSATVTPLYIK